jgi:hypothetical protein
MTHCWHARPSCTLCTAYMYCVISCKTAIMLADGRVVSNERRAGDIWISSTITHINCSICYCERPACQLGYHYDMYKVFVYVRAFRQGAAPSLLTRAPSTALRRCCLPSRTATARPRAS